MYVAREEETTKYLHMVRMYVAQGPPPMHTRNEGIKSASMQCVRPNFFMLTQLCTIGQVLYYWVESPDFVVG